MVRRRISAPAPLLAVGGLDPSGHAGLMADVRVFENLGLDYRVATTAITAQSEKKFFGWKPVDLNLFRAQLEAAGSKIAGVKIGMLGTAAHVRALAAWLRKIRPAWVIWDPVWRSSTGGLLFEGKLSDLAPLFSHISAWTPNLPEAELFLGRALPDLKAARNALPELWRRAKKKSFVVLKGGHLPAPEKAIDWWFDGSKLHELQGSRLAGSRRGSGCTFASALLAGLTKGSIPLAAARFAKAYVRKHLFSA